jgi:hypothetical protein
MSDERRSWDHDRDLGPGDAALVRRIAEAYRPPEASASERVAFRARLDARIRRGSTRRVWVAGFATVAAAAAFVWLRGPAPVGPIAVPPDTAAGDALLALAASSEEEALPADYQAIDDLFLENEGV